MIFELVVETVFMRKGFLTKEREILLLYPGGRCSVGRTPKNKVVRGCVNMSRGRYCVLSGFSCHS